MRHRKLEVRNREDKKRHFLKYFSFGRGSLESGEFVCPLIKAIIFHDSILIK